MTYPARFISWAILLAFPAACAGGEPGRVAGIIGVEPLLARLSALTGARDPGPPALSLEELSLHQRIIEAVVTASLDVDSAVDQIDYERAQIVELQSILLARRQRAIGTTNLATLALSTGLGALSGVLQFSDTTKGAGNAIGFVAGGISTLLSFHSVRQQHSGNRQPWALPSMLAPFLIQAQEHNAYPPDAWAYLDSATEGASRRERLLAQWRTAGRFPALDSPQSQSKIGLLTGTNAADKKLTMDLLSERAAMLADVRDELAMMKRDLGEIMRGIKVSR
jgi:hypothetical protein